MPPLAAAIRCASTALALSPSATSRSAAKAFSTRRIGSDLTSVRACVPQALQRPQVASSLRQQVRGTRATMSTFDKEEVRKQETQPGLEHKMGEQPSTLKEEYKPASKLKGKISLITGGDSGIGRSVAYHFALEGATVAFTYLEEEKKDAEDTLNLLKEFKTEGAHDPLAIPGDLGDDAMCKKVVEEVVRKYGGIDILVNNCAEQTVHQDFLEISPEEWERTFRTNIHSYFYMTRHVLPYMKEESSIIMSTSVNAYKGNKALIPYTATKGAIVGFIRSLALSVAEKKIRVNGVAPGPVWTPLIPATMGEEKVESFGSQTPLGRAGQPDEIAPAYVFLASHDSTYFTGQVLHPNGGTIVNA